MKKLWLLILMFNSVNSYATELIEQEEIKEIEITESIAKPLTKKIYYKISISKEGKIIYKSEIEVKNSEIYPLIAVTEENSKESANEKLVLNNSNSKDTSTNMDIKSSESVFYIKMVSYANKNNKNLWSTFFIEDGIENKNQSGVVGQKNLDDKKGFVINYNNLPDNNYNKNEMIISHYNGKMAEAMFGDYQFNVQATIIK